MAFSAYRRFGELYARIGFCPREKGDRDDAGRRSGFRVGSRHAFRGVPANFVRSWTYIVCRKYAPYSWIARAGMPWPASVFANLMESAKREGVV